MKYYAEIKEGGSILLMYKNIEYMLLDTLVTYVGSDSFIVKK